MSLGTKVGGLRSIFQFDNRWQLIAQRILFSGTHLHIYRRGSLEILIDHAAGDVCGLRECFTTNMYRQYLPGMNFRSPLRVLDMGAHIGGFPLVLRDSGCEIGELVSVELNPVTFSRMRFNIERNLPTTRCTLINAGIAGEAGEIELALGSGSTSDSILKPTISANPVARRIKLITVDQAVEQAGWSDDLPIDLCKLDVEGAEYGVFSHPGHSALKRCRFLLIEVHPVSGCRPDDAKNALVNLGFVQVPAPQDPYPDVFCYRNQALEDASKGSA